MKTMVLRRLLGIVFTLTATVMFGCDMVVNTFIGETSTTPNTDTKNTLKVGILQPPNYYPSFTRGAALARDEINAGMDSVSIEFVHRAETDRDVHGYPNGIG